MYDQAIPNEPLGSSSSPTSVATATLGVGGVATPSPIQHSLQQHQQSAATAIPFITDSAPSHLNFSSSIISSVTSPTLTSSSATSQLQARLSQPTLLQQQQNLQPQAQPQLRYLLERGTNDPPSLPPPIGAITAPSVSSSVVISSAGGGGLVTTSTSQLTAQPQQMNNPPSSPAPLTTNLLSSVSPQGATTSHRVWVPGRKKSIYLEHLVVKELRCKVALQYPTMLNPLKPSISFTRVSSQPHKLNWSCLSFSYTRMYNGLAWLGFSMQCPNYKIVII